MQISPLSNSFNRLTPYRNSSNQVQNQVQNPLKSVETAGTVGMTPAEASGRYIVNFSGKINPENKLSKSDNNFAEGLGKIYRLDDEQVETVKTIISDFLKENNFKQITDMRSDDIFEFANESAMLAEQLSNALELTDYEDTNMVFLLTDQINIGDINNKSFRNGIDLIEANKYVKDYTPFENFLNNYGVNDFDDISKSFHFLEKVAKKQGCETLFDLFNAKNRKIGRNAVIELCKRIDGEAPDEETLADMMIDLVELSKQSEKERLQGINIRKESEKIEDGIDTLIIADKISKTLNIEMSKELLELLDARKTNREVHKDGQSAIEVAYKIAEKYDLSGKDIDNIIKIIENVENKSNKERMDGLIDSLSEED